MKSSTDDFDDEGDIKDTLNELSAVMDFRSVRGNLILRCPQPGDRFQPLGMEGSIKLSDLFINEKIPQPARKSWPLLCDDEGIVWVVGLRVADRVKIARLRHGGPWAPWTKTRPGGDGRC